MALRNRRDRIVLCASKIVGAFARYTPNRGQERLLRLVEEVFGVKRWVTRSEFGFILFVNRNDLVQRHILTYGFWDKEVGDYLKSILTENDVFFDIGANIGYFSLVAASIGVSSIVAFEPFAYLARLAEENVSLNGFEKIIRIVPVALGAIQGTANYLAGPDWNSGAGKIVPVPDGGSGSSVPIMTLDAFLSDTDSPWPTVIKLDVEGFELDVLQGARKLFETRPPRAVVFEANCDDAGRVVDEKIVEFFESFNYQIKHLHRPVHESKENFVAALK